jgi:hypothetical protein
VRNAVRLGAPPVAASSSAMTPLRHPQWVTIARRAEKS